MLSGSALNGELEGVPTHYRRLLDHLVGLPVENRRGAFMAFLTSRSDDEAKDIIKAVADIRPNEPAPVPETRRLTAHLGDLSRSNGADRFVWNNWLVRGHFNLLSSDPKIGKTYVTMDLARRMYFAEPWPDGQPPTFPRGTKTLWVCGDRHQDELLAYATSFGVPPEAILLNANPDEAYGGWDLDNYANVKSLRNRVEAEKPGLVIIDTLWRATRRKLYKEDEVNLLMDPLITISQECDVAILGLMHLSKDADTLGRRLEGLARAILKMSRPDPSQPSRRTLWVNGNFKEPPPLGVTLRDGGCDYDSNPPEQREPGKAGRPPEKALKAMTFLENKLADGDRPGCELIDEWKALGESKATLFNARNAMEAAGQLVVDKYAKPQLWRLAGDDRGQELLDGQELDSSPFLTL
ncbi:MAG: AAA family ATPase [Isosphaerales bacterium]